MRSVIVPADRRPSVDHVNTMIDSARAETHDGAPVAEHGPISLGPRVAGRPDLGDVLLTREDVTGDPSCDLLSIATVNGIGLFLRRSSDAWDLRYSGAVGAWETFVHPGWEDGWASPSVPWRSHGSHADAVAALREAVASRG